MPSRRYPVVFLESFAGLRLRNAYHCYTGSRTGDRTGGAFSMSANFQGFRGACEEPSRAHALVCSIRHGVDSPVAALLRGDFIVVINFFLCF